MNIALMSHDRKKELMVQFCIAYCGILSKHTICATNTTGRLVAEATGLPVQLFLSHEHGGSQQIGARIAYNEIDMVLFFSDPQSNDLDADLKYITRLCDQYNIPVATNVATAEMLIHGLERGDLDWRDIINPKTKPFTAETANHRPAPARRPGGAAAHAAEGRRNSLPAAASEITGVPARWIPSGGARGDLDWRDIINPKTKPFTA